jgi:signal transduction histidine kinase
MSFSFATSLPNYDARRSASDLAGITLSANLQASGRERGGQRSRITQLREAMERLLGERLRTRHDRRAPQAQFLSLADAFAGVPDALDFPHTVDFQVVVDGQPKDLRPQLRQEIYRIGREAIVNAYRHSQASQIEMQIEYRPAVLRISVRDNGCGIDSQLLRRSENRGLEGMRERAEEIGGRLRILSKVALGTEVELCVPGRIVFDRPGEQC